MNNVSAIINNMTIKERTDGRFEGRVTYSGSVVKTKILDFYNELI